MARNSFEPGHKKHGGRQKGTKNRTTVWVLESLKKHGVDYEKMLADALKSRDLEMLDRLAKLAPHIANKPKETVGMEGIEELVIMPFVENDAKKAGKSDKDEKPGA